MLFIYVQILLFLNIDSENWKGIYKLLIQLPLKSKNRNKITFNFYIISFCIIVYNDIFIVIKENAYNMHFNSLWTKESLGDNQVNEWTQQTRVNAMKSPVQSINFSFNHSQAHY